MTTMFFIKQANISEIMLTKHFPKIIHLKRLICFFGYLEKHYNKGGLNKMKIKKILAIAVCNALIASGTYTNSIVHANKTNTIDYQEDNSNILYEDNNEESEDVTNLKELGLDSLFYNSSPPYFKNTPCKEEIYDDNNNLYETIYYKYDENNNLINKNDTTGREWVYKYNTNGDLTEYTFYGRDDIYHDGETYILEYAYEEKNQFCPYNCKSVNTYYIGYLHPDFTEYYYYDDTGKLIEYEELMHNVYEKYEYNSNGLISKKIVYENNKKEEIASYTNYEYDANNNLIRESTLGHYNEIITYNYDNNGNLIRKKVTSNFEHDLWEDYLEHNHISYYYYDNSVSTSGIYCSSTYPSIVAGMVTEKSNSEDHLEYRWVAYEESSGNWFEISPWKKNNEWLNWTPDKSGNYVIVGQVRVIGNENSQVESSFGVPYHKHIKGICQMPYTGEGGGFLIGVESYDNPNQSYTYEMLILDCTLLAEGKDAWTYSTGKCGVAEGNALWTIWQPKYGYYWNLFRIYDSKGKMIDEACFGFVNAY